MEQEKRYMNEDRKNVDPAKIIIGGLDLIGKYCWAFKEYEILGGWY